MQILKYGFIVVLLTALSIINLSCKQSVKTSTDDEGEGGGISALTGDLADCEVDVLDFATHGGKYWRCQSGSDIFTWMITVDDRNQYPCSGSYSHGQTYFMFSCTQSECGLITFLNTTSSGEKSATPPPNMPKSDEAVSYELPPPNDTIRTITVSGMSGGTAQSSWSFHQSGDDGEYDVTCTLESEVAL